MPPQNRLKSANRTVRLAGRRSRAPGRCEPWRVGMTLDPMDTDKQGTFAALAVPNFRRYVSGQSLSLIGTWV